MPRLPLSLLGGLALACSALAATAGPTPSRTPRVNYALHCQGCHLPDGRGMAGKVPDMRGQLSRFLGVEGGRAYLIQVPGTANSKLSDADTAALINWLVIEMGPAPPSGFRPYSAHEIRVLRVRRLNDPARVRAELLSRADQVDLFIDSD